MASVLDRTMVEYFKKLNPSVHNSLEHSFLSHKLKMTPKRIGHQILFDSTNKIKKFSRNQDRNGLDDLKLNSTIDLEFENGQSF